MRNWIALVALAACGGGSANPIDARIDAGSGPADARILADAFDLTARPYDLFVPTGYTAGTPTPLVVVLHGYGADSSVQENYFQIQPIAESEVFLYAKPNGTPDSELNRFWNGTDACCDLGGVGVDDVTYLRAVIDDVAASYTVDPKRIYLVGHSNGGFMSHRMACDAADQIAAIVSLAGVVWNDASRCNPSAPVSVAQVHGTADNVIFYGGGSIFSLPPYPSVDATITTWRTKNGCTGAGAPTTIDLDTQVPGAETTVTPATGCAGGSTVELWRMEGSSHIPGLDLTWGQRVWEFLDAHPKP